MTTKLQVIYTHFQSLPTVHHKILYLQEHKTELEKLGINPTKLIQHYTKQGDKPYKPSTNKSDFL
mgnify:FL=1